MRSGLAFLPAAALALSVASVPASATSDYDELLRLVPSDANAVILINARGALASQYAKDQQWEAQRKMKAADHALQVPLGAVKYIRSANLDLTSHQPTWEVAAMTHSDPLDADKIAQAEGGHTDTIADLPAAVSPRDFTAVIFNDRVVGAISPADRQSATRWARAAKDRAKPALSSYLTDAVKNADLEETQYFIAIDMDGVVSPKDIFPNIAAAKLVKDANLDPVQIAEVIASIRGASLALAFADEATCSITLTFGDSPQPLKPIMKQAVLAGMAKHGVYIGEAEDWDATIEGNSIVLSGEIFTSGLRRIGSLLASPHPTTAPVKEDAEELTPEQATLAHYKAVKQIVDDVQKAENAQQISDIATFLDRYARKIDNLPILNVDPEMLGWSEYVSRSLRAASVRLKDVRLNTAAKAAEHSNFYDTEDTGGAPVATVKTNYRGKYYNRDSYYSGSGRYHGNNNSYRYGNYRGTEYQQVEYGQERYRLKYQERERRAIALEERATGKQEAMKIIQAIQDSVPEIRKSMTQKYSVEF